MASFGYPPEESQQPHSGPARFDSFHNEQSSATPSSSNLIHSTAVHVKTMFMLSSTPEILSPPSPSSSSHPPLASIPRPSLTLDVISLDTPIPNPAEPGEYFAIQNNTSSPSDQDMYFDDEGLGPLEKIYLFSRSRAIFHRVFISQALPTFLPQVSPSEAVEYVLPLLNGLGTDQDDSVREAFVAQLVPIMWWFFINCQVVESDESVHEPEGRPRLSVGTFTPLLGSLLLSSNPVVGDSARWSIVGLLTRLRGFIDEVDNFSPTTLAADLKRLTEHERRLIERELIEGVVLGMARLDYEDPPTHKETRVANNAESDTVVGDLLSVERDGLSPNTLASTSASTSDGHSALKASAEPAAHNVLLEDVSSSLGLVPATSVPRSLEKNDEPDEARVHYSHDIDNDIGEEAAVGRVASMSLIAAVTASGQMDQTIGPLFVAEVRRVGSDPIYWVRREAAYALGALAKAASQEEVIQYLLPLYENFICDTTWHVRHSALFALPGLLGRLPQNQRRAFVLSQFKSLSADPSRSVRFGLLEILGEVIYAFAEDPVGPPLELIQLFTGPPRSALPVYNAPSISSRESSSATSELVNQSLSGLEVSTLSVPHGLQHSSLDEITQDMDRPLICAFNFPAVTLALGRDRWQEIRWYYLELTQHASVKVLRTFAASVGEMARIVGSDHAYQDLRPFFWNALRIGDEEVKVKALESMAMLLSSLRENDRDAFGRELVDAWTASLRGWREREVCARAFSGLSHLLKDSGYVMRDLLLKALTDGVAAVRDAAVAQLPGCVKGLGEKSDSVRALRVSIAELAVSSSYRRRATFVSCTQSVSLSRELEGSEVQEESFWLPLLRLARDPIIDVRIGLSRLVSLICYKHFSSTKYPALVRDIARILGGDASEEVRSYVYFLNFPHPRSIALPPPPVISSMSTSNPPTPFATFSKPPPFFPYPELRDLVIEDSDEDVAVDAPDPPAEDPPSPSSAPPQPPSVAGSATVAVATAAQAARPRPPLHRARTV